MVKLESVHGGHNSVAVGVRKGSYKEEVLADALAKRVAELTGARYIPQDKGDVNQNLAYFVREMDKKRGANLSIHFNAFNGSAHGTESFSYAGDSIGKSISTNMSNKVSNVLGTFNRGNKNAPLYVIDWSQDVTTLLEVCFLDNDNDMKKFMTKHEEVAHAIASCYDNYKGGNTVNKPKPPVNKPKPPVKPRHKVRTYWFDPKSPSLKKVLDYNKDKKYNHKQTKASDGRIMVETFWFTQDSSNKHDLITFYEKNYCNYDIQIEKQ